MCSPCCLMLGADQATRKSLNHWRKMKSEALETDVWSRALYFAPCFKVATKAATSPSGFLKIITYRPCWVKTSVCKAVHRPCWVFTQKQLLTQTANKAWLLLFYNWGTWDSKKFRVLRKVAEAGAEQREISDSQPKPLHTRLSFIKIVGVTFNWGTDLGWSRSCHQLQSNIIAPTLLSSQMS